MFKRIFSLFLVLVFMASFCLSALAADYTAADFSELETAFGDSSGENVNIDITADIIFERSLSANEGITYTIGSQSGNALVNSTFSGSGDVVINTDVKGENAAALTAIEAVDVTVTKDITSNSAGVVSYNESSITVEGSIEAGETGVDAREESIVSVTGDVHGGDGNPDDVNFSNPASFSDGSTGVLACDNATVTVGGNVSGGNSYGTWGYGADGVLATGTSSVTVEGNVTGGDVIADPETLSDTSNGVYNSLGGTGIWIDGGATVTVNGSVKGGNTNGDGGTGGKGITIIAHSTPASVTVAKSVSGGKASAENGYDGFGIDISIPEPDPSAPPMEEPALPNLTVGSVDTVESNLPAEEHEAFVKSITVTDAETPDDGSNGNDAVTPDDGSNGNDAVTPDDGSDGNDVPPPNDGFDSNEAETPAAPLPMRDHFWKNVAKQIRESKKGDELTVDAAHRTTMPSYIPELVAEYEITLTVQWNGGEDIVITGNVDIPGSIIKLSKLAELL